LINYFRYCGSDLKGLTLTSESNLAILTFTSNSQQQSKGFRATLSEVKTSTVTSSTASYLDTLRDSLSGSEAPDVIEERERLHWALSAIYGFIKSLPFYKIL